MASIKAGTYTVGELLQAAKFDFENKAAADYLNGQPDFRRVQIGGLGFDSLDSVVVVPATADEVLITLDGKKEVVVDVTLDDAQQEERKLAFEIAADADGPVARAVQQDRADAQEASAEK